mgnify:CR=1 FL=1
MNELKVGFLSLIAIASLVIVSLQITSNKATFGDFVEYHTILNDATGIYEKSSIKVAGIVAGRIISIQLSGSQALVKFEILKQIKITQFSRLRIKSVGFLGDKYIDIFLGNPEAPRLKEFGMVPNETGAGFEQLGKDASEILKDVKVIAKAIKDSLYTEDKQNAIKLIVQQINEFSHNANDISKSLKKVLITNEGKISDIIANLEKVSQQLAFETDRYQDDSFMNDLDGVGPILEKVNSAVSDLEVIMADVRSGKGTVGKLLRDEEVIDKVNETLSGVNRIVGRVNRFKTNISIFSGVNNNEGSRTDAEIDLIPGPERFFRFGVISGDTTSIESQTTTTTSTDGGPDVVTDKVESSNSEYRFNLQIGREIGPYTVRAGIIESTGGLGFDYKLPAYGFKSTFDVFDYREDIGANLKLGTEVRLWNILHAKVTAEELSRSPDFHVYTFSAGLKFSDEDLATLIGLAL